MKYDIRICRCGKIHFINRGTVEDAIKADKNLVVICRSCGHSFVIGADEDVYEDEAGNIVPCYIMYTNDLDDNAVIDASQFIEGSEHQQKLLHQIIYSKGVTVPMRSGQNANMYSAGRFCDMWYPDLYMIDRADVTPDEVHKFIDEYHRDRYTVDMDRLIRSLSDDQAEGLSHMWMSQFNWAGTKWETAYNSK